MRVLYADSTYFCRAAASFGGSSSGGTSSSPSTIGVKGVGKEAPELLNDPLLEEAEVKKMKEYFNHLFKYSNVSALVSD